MALIIYKNVKKGVWYLVVAGFMFWFWSSWELPAAEATRPHAKSTADYPDIADVRSAYNKCMIDSLHNGDSILDMYAKCEPNLGTAWCKELGLPHPAVGLMQDPPDQRCAEVTKQESDNIILIFGSESQKTELAEDR